jgi:FAD/FMN-containing dehydrogenase
VLRCEAGMLLQDLQRWCMPRAWRLPIVPGTQLITVGGAIANDVHGKNHHRFGSFGDHVRSFQLARSDGSLNECVAGEPFFAATVGGLGLTGVITQAEIQLQPSLGPWLQVESLPYRDLSEFFALADSSEQNWEHTVSWIDCLNRAGRGIFLRANEVASDAAIPAKKPARRVPLVPPLSLINRFSLRPFNALYYQLKKSQSVSLQYYEDFFHPLDSLHDWNRIYGPRGFYQYQCVLPRATGQAGIQALLQQIHRANAGSFLAVLKTFGARPSVGMLSFAQPGVTLALDFPNHGAASLELFASLDAVVREAGGRLYMAKDARMSRDLFEAGYPRLSEFLGHRDPGISSAMSRRLMGS